MSHYFGYIRVSTTKQGEHGVSLPEQRDAISRYAARHGLAIDHWFEEQQTAAKRGRPVFNRMLFLLKQRRATGVIIHKIDRSARNLRDWADLGDLIDQGIEVHFANESLDLHSRGGRLSADIQAVVAADYIRNLKEELRKGFYGRLKQGLFPMRAPIGYLDRGKGRPKEPDPLKAPLVRRAFDLYSSAKYSLHTLLDELTHLGLRNRNGQPLTINGLTTILNNPFYYGLIRLTKTGETFDGKHEPIITRSLFARVQNVLHGKLHRGPVVHQFTFRRLVRCASCGYALIGETQKGHVYYRCHVCRGISLREETIHNAVVEALQPLALDDEEKAWLAWELSRIETTWKDDRGALERSLKLSISQIADRLNRLTDAYLDGVVDKEAYEARKMALLDEKRTLTDRLADLQHDQAGAVQTLKHFLELASAAYLDYFSYESSERRDLVTLVTSNLTAVGNNVIVKRQSAFELLARRYQTRLGGPYRDIPRTWTELCSRFMHMIKTKDLVLPEKKPLEELLDAA